MPNAKYTPEEVTSQGQTIYEQQIRDEIEPRNKGKFLVIDIETGVYEIDDDDLVATKRLLANCPNAVIYGLRIGFPTVYRIDGRFSVNAQ
jgi:hypothetical protein